MPAVVIGGGSHLFEFDEGTTTQFVSNSSPTALNVPDDGVNFLWSTAGAGKSHAIFHSLGDENLNFVPSSADSVTLALMGTSLYFVSPTVNITSMVGTWQIQYLTTAGTVYVPLTTMSGSFTIPAATSLAISGNIEAIKFVSSGSGQISVTSINTSVNCFVEDTRIMTPTGEVPVETLRQGDLVTLADGTTKPVRAIGSTFVNAKLSNPKTMNPICISRNALGQETPNRDLMVSPEHAICLDGVLYNAGSLVNDTSIYQLATVAGDGFTYYHVDVEDHCLLMSHGVAAESYIDYAGNDLFEDGTDHKQIKEMALPRISSKRMLPAELRTRLSMKSAA